MTNLVLFWHRRDLRLSDNVGLHYAFKITPKVVGVFCFDPALIQASEVAPARLSYLLGCLAELQTAYARLGSRLLIFQGDPRSVLPSVAQALSAQAVYWNQDVEPYAHKRDQAVYEALKGVGVAVSAHWDQLLHVPGLIRTSTVESKPYTVFTPFRKNWSRQPKETPYPQPQRAIDLNPTEQDIAMQCGAIGLPELDDFGMYWEGGFPLEPGEAAAHERLQEFTASLIYGYARDRDFPSLPATSGLSPALKFGTVGIRTVWQATLTAEGASQDEVSTGGVEAWQSELAWRDFYQMAMFFNPKLADGPFRPEWATFPWENDRAKFQAWCEGRTGYPIVDAAMRQLNQTGWMHNRCRMIVASFLTKDLIIDWRWGERYFMQRLVDGDLSANNGGWQWSASSGMDPKPLRIFNPTTQAKKCDPSGQYIREWVPELRTLSTNRLMSGNLTPLEVQSYRYVLPIVDHSVQQKRFKALYQQNKLISPSVAATPG